MGEGDVNHQVKLLAQLITQPITAYVSELVARKPSSVAPPKSTTMRCVPYTVPCAGCQLALGLVNVADAVAPVADCRLLAPCRTM